MSNVEINAPNMTNRIVVDLKTNLILFIYEYQAVDYL